MWVILAFKSWLAQWQLGSFRKTVNALSLSLVE
jgi:hypothetical protein